jgi:hypothetical protein
MKYIVEVKYTNPSHEHVSLRRRVDSVNRLIEAKTPEEALNRAANMQRALGFHIQSANIIEQKIEKPESAKNIAEEVKEESVQEALLPKQQAVADKLKDTELAANKEKAGFKYGKALRAAKVAAKKLKEESETQYIEEKLSASDPTSKWISDFVASDNPKFAGKSKKERIRMALGAKYAAMRNEEVEQVDEVTGYEGVKDRTDMIKRAAAMNRMGKGVFLSKVKARAAEMKKEKAAKELTKEETEVVEAADPGSMKVVNKKVEAQAVKDTKNSEKKMKATEKAVQLAKNKKNPVNLKPVLGGDKVKNA